MFGDSKNTILAIVLSALVLIGWQYFIGGPQLEKQRQEAAQQQQAQQTTPAPGEAKTTPVVPSQPSNAPTAPGNQSTAIAAQPVTRDAALAASPRVATLAPGALASQASASSGDEKHRARHPRFRHTVS